MFLIPGESKKYTRLMGYKNVTIASILKIGLGLDSKNLRLDHDMKNNNFRSPSNKLLTLKQLASFRKLAKIDQKQGTKSKNGDFGIPMSTQTLRTFWKQTRSKRENETTPPGQEVLAGMFPGKQIMNQKALKRVLKVNQLDA